MCGSSCGCNPISSIGIASFFALLSLALSAVAISSPWWTIQNPPISLLRDILGSTLALNSPMKVFLLSISFDQGQPILFSDILKKTGVASFLSNNEKRNFQILEDYGQAATTMFSLTIVLYIIVIAFSITRAVLTKGVTTGSFLSHFATTGVPSSFAFLFANIAFWVGFGGTGTAAVIAGASDAAISLGNTGISSGPGLTSAGLAILTSMAALCFEPSCCCCCGRVNQMWKDKADLNVNINLDPALTVRQQQQVLSAPQPPPPPPPPPTSEWKTVIDPSSGKPYYFNSRTQETSWTQPSPAAAFPPPLLRLHLHLPLLRLQLHPPRQSGRL